MGHFRLKRSGRLNFVSKRRGLQRAVKKKRGSQVDRVYHHASGVYPRQVRWLIDQLRFRQLTNGLYSASLSILSLHINAGRLSTPAPASRIALISMGRISIRRFISLLVSARMRVFRYLAKRKWVQWECNERILRTPSSLRD